MAAGMLSGLFSPQFRDLRLEEKDEEDRLRQIAEMGGFKQAGYAGLSGAQTAGKALGRLAAAATGTDPRSPAQRGQAAVEAAKAQVAQLGFDPDDPKSIDQFYKQVIAILQKQGLAAEALAVAKDWNAQKLATSKESLAVREMERKEARDKAIDARAAEKNAALKLKFGAAASPMGKMLADYERADARNDSFAKGQLLKAIQNLAGPGWKAVDLGDRVELRNAETGEVIGGTLDKGLAPVAELKDENAKKTAADAYGEYMAGLQRQYDAAVELHNHPGVEGITGRFGRYVGEEGAGGFLASTISSDAAGAALALYKQVTGGTFLAGLTKLKNASKTGATGLGAVSEREGEKVQSDAAALDRLQQAPDFRRQLATYIQEIEGFAGRLSAGAAKDGIPPRPLAAKALTVPGKGKGRGKPAPAPAASAPARAGGDWTSEKERRYQELLKKRGQGGS